MIGLLIWIVLSVSTPLSCHQTRYSTFPSLFPSSFSLFAYSLLSKGLLYYEPTSSGEDDWPSDDPPDPTVLLAPARPRPARAPFVGGRVALVRDTNLPFEGQGAILAPVDNAFDSGATPYQDEMSRFERQTSRPNAMDDISSESVDKYTHKKKN